MAMPLRHAERRTPLRSLLLLAFVATFVQAPSSARAVANFDYDFENLPLGSITGQDGWTASPEFSVVTGTGVNASHCARGALGLPIQEAWRLLPATFYYTAADTAVEWSCRAMMFGLGANKNAMAGPSGYGVTNGDVFGMSSEHGGSPVTFLSAVGVQGGDVLQFGHWYQFRVVVNFAIPGGSATLSYRDLTAGQATFTVDSQLHDTNLGAVTDAQGRYPYEEVYLRAEDPDGLGCFVDDLHIGAPGSSTTGVGAGSPAVTEGTLAVAPNPSAQSALPDIRFALQVAARVQLAIYDVRGSRVRVLADATLGSGAHTVRWDLADDAGHAVRAGVYFVRFTAGGRTIVARMVRVGGA